MQASVECLGQFGRLLEIGKYDMANRSSLPMHCMLKGVSYEGIVLDRLWNAPGMAKQVLVLGRLDLAHERGAIHRYSRQPARWVHAFS